MWQEIERISGVPFPRGSHRKLDDNIEFNFANITNASQCKNEVDVIRLQSDLLVATNHANAAEIESGSERERNRILEEENTNLRAELQQLSDNLQSRMLELDEKNIELNRTSNIIESLQTNMKHVEEKMISRASSLEIDLANQMAKEEVLRSEHSKAVQEVEKLRLRNAVQEERIQHLHENLRETTQASKQKEHNAETIAHAEAKHSLQMLEAKLQHINEQLLKAEDRERQASTRADEARQQALNTHEHLHIVVEKVREEMSALHTADMEKLNNELKSSKHQITILTEQLHEQHNRLVNDTDRFAKNNAESEKLIEEAARELEDQISHCKRLQTELDQVRIHCEHAPLNYDHIFVTVILFIPMRSPMSQEIFCRQALCPST